LEHPDLLSSRTPLSVVCRLTLLNTAPSLPPLVLAPHYIMAPPIPTSRTPLSTVNPTLLHSKFSPPLLRPHLLTSDFTPVLPSFPLYLPHNHPGATVRGQSPGAATHGSLPPTVGVGAALYQGHTQHCSPLPLLAYPPFIAFFAPKICANSPSPPLKSFHPPVTIP